MTTRRDLKLWDIINFRCSRIAPVGGPTDLTIYIAGSVAELESKQLTTKLPVDRCILGPII
jgi:hypothetical protein